MKIVLFRHAEKSSHGGLNPPLSQTGLRQAEIILQFVQERTLPKPQRILTSPKLRTQQTFENLARWSNVRAESLAHLDERGQLESMAQFRQRCTVALQMIEAFADQQCVYVCSHMDWIEEVLTLIPANEDILKPELTSWVSGQFAQFDFVQPFWQYLGTGRVRG